LEVGIQTLLTTELSRSMELHVVDIRGLMDMDETGPQSGLARLKASIGLFVEGEIARAGQRIIINIHTIDNQTDKIIKADNAEGNSDEEIYAMVTRLADKIRAILEIKAAEAEVEEQWLKDITTNSVGAYREFVYGHERFLKTDWRGAKTRYENAVRIDSTFAMAYVWLSTIYSMLDDYDGMQRSYQKAFALRDVLSLKEQIFVDIFETELAENWSNQIDLTRRIVKMDPESNFWMFILGRAYYKHHQYNEAIAALEPQCFRKWRFAYAYYFLAGSYLELKRFDEAIEVQKIGLQLRPDFTAFYAWISAIYFHLDDSTNGELYKRWFYSKTNNSNPDNAEQYLEAGNGYRHLNLHDEAVKCYEKGADVNPDYYELYYWLGELFDNKGKYQEAADFYQRFLIYQDQGKKADDARIKLKRLQDSLVTDPIPQ
jgi:tetratricopeptide (TPR) repeat protein